MEHVSAAVPDQQGVQRAERSSFAAGLRPDSRRDRRRRTRSWRVRPTLGLPSWGRSIGRWADGSRCPTAEGAAVLVRGAAFPPAGRPGRVDGDVALKFAFDRRDVDAQIVQDAPCPAAGIQCQRCEEVLGANLRWGVGRAAGRRVACGGQRADRLGRHRWSLIVRDTGGRAETAATRRGSRRHARRGVRGLRPRRPPSGARSAGGGCRSRRPPRCAGLLPVGVETCLQARRGPGGE